MSSASVVKLITKLFKFGLVGMSGLLVDYGITILLKEEIGINKYLANSAGFAFAATTNYLLNRIWTFRSSNPEIAREYTIFFLIALGGLAINNGIIWLLNDYTVGLNFYLSKFIAIVVVFAWNFGFNNYYNFKQANTLGESQMHY